MISRVSKAFFIPADPLSPFLSFFVITNFGKSQRAHAAAPACLLRQAEGRSLEERLGRGAGVAGWLSGVPSCSDPVVLGGGRGQTRGALSSCGATLILLCLALGGARHLAVPDQA